MIMEIRICVFWFCFDTKMLHVLLPFPWVINLQISTETSNQNSPNLTQSKQRDFRRTKMLKCSCVEMFQEQELLSLQLYIQPCCQSNHKEGRLRGPVSVWRSQKSGIGAASWGAI